MDLVEEYWQEPSQEGETGEMIFDKFMLRNRKFFEGPMDEAEEEEDSEEFEEKLAEIWQQYKDMHESLIIKIVQESDLSV